MLTDTDSKCQTLNENTRGEQYAANLQAFFSFIVSFVETHGQAPTHREIHRATRYNEKRIKRYIRTLERQGHIVRVQPGRWRQPNIHIVSKEHIINEALNRAGYSVTRTSQFQRYIISQEQGQ